MRVRLKKMSFQNPVTTLVIKTRFSIAAIRFWKNDEKGFVAHL
jgi:hypothetical protein